jgi:hypothetical protein
MTNNRYLIGLIGEFSGFGIMKKKRTENPHSILLDLAG